MLGLASVDGRWCTGGHVLSQGVLKGMAIATPTSSSSIVDRMVRAAKLQVPLYEEVEADATATNQALTVVVLAAVASGLGTAIGAAMAGRGSSVAGVLIGGVIAALVGWAVWSFVVYFVGTRMFGGTATYGEVLRTLGFADSPQVLLILSFVPGVGPLISVVVFFWSIVSSFIATRQALDLDNTKTVFTIIIGVVALLIVIGVLGAIIGSLVGVALFATGAGR
jgi:hypothetical protein